MPLEWPKKWQKRQKNKKQTKKNHLHQFLTIDHEGILLKNEMIQISHLWTSAHVNFTVVFFYFIFFLKWGKGKEKIVCGGSQHSKENTCHCYRVPSQEGMLIQGFLTRDAHQNHLWHCFLHISLWLHFSIFWIGESGERPEFVGRSYRDNAECLLLLWTVSFTLPIKPFPGPFGQWC